MSDTGDRLRELANKIDEAPWPMSVGVMISGDVQYLLASKTSGDPQRDALILVTMIHQAVTTKDMS